MLRLRTGRASNTHTSLSLAGIDKIRNHSVATHYFYISTFIRFVIVQIVRIDACYVFVESFVEFCRMSVEKSDDRSTWKLEMRFVDLCTLACVGRTFEREADTAVVFLLLLRGYVLSFLRLATISVKTHCL